ncbi:MAG: ATP-binding protein [Elusimicrobiota bacterium]
MQSKPRGRLSYKLLLWFLLISLVPVGIMGWHLTNTSFSVFKEVSLRNQQQDAIRFAETVSLTIDGFEDVLQETARLGEIAEASTDARQSYLLRVMRLHPEFVELSVVEPSGRESVRLGRFQQANLETRDFYQSAPFRTALRRKHYVGSLERLKGLYPALTIAVPILGEAPITSTPTIQGVLLGKVSLNGLSNLLQREVPKEDKRQVSVAAPDGFLIAHSDPSQVYKQGATLPKSIVSFLAKRRNESGGDELDLANGVKVLGAYATVPDVGWLVYVQQPLETAYRAASEIRRQIGRILVWVVIVTMLLSLAVAAHITMPIRELTAIADQLTVGQFEDLPQLTLTNDEIGDLGQSFFQMSESLRDKTDELLQAKTALERFQGTLERRVQARDRELQAAQNELIVKERLAAMGAMASVVGHEIRNPLAVINNSIFFIKAKLGKDNRLDAKMTRHVRIIESEIQQASSIINEILTYSRSRELKLKVQPINHFVNEVLAVHPLPPHVRVVREFDSRDPLVNIDADEMRQALRNLIGNAIDVMPKTGTLTVKTELVQDRWARIDIRDTGPGIPPDILNKMFAPFYTTKARGTGLGLAVVVKAMNRHEGRVEAFSQVGKGTVFRLSIPIHKGSAAQAGR